MDIDPDQPVLVAGASGFVGSHITRALVARGRKVRILLRKTSRRAAFEGLPVEIVEGDVLAPETLRPAMRGCATIFYSVVDPRFWLTDQTPIWRNNVEGLVHAMDAALEAGIGRFIFTSTMGTLGLNPDGPVTEDIPFNWADRAPPYIMARLEAETQLLRYAREKGLPGIALCVANTYGPQDHQPTPHNGMLWQIASGRMKATLDGGQPTVDIRDVAEAALLAEAKGRPGERYIIAHEYVQARDFYAMAVAERGTAMPKLIPYRTAYAITWLTERWMRLRGRTDFMARTDGLYLSQVFRAMDHGKARRELGWHPRPLRETVRDTIAWFAARDA
jgi:dihydroflavonol-4-reductase